MPHSILARLNLDEVLSDSDRRSNASSDDGTVIAQRIPYELLYYIFTLSLSASGPEWGGVLTTWHSHEEDTARLPLTCRAWRLAAQHLLFNSVSLLSARSAEAFTASAIARPDLADKVQYLVVGLSEKETWPAVVVNGRRVGERISAGDGEGDSGASAVIQTQAVASAAMITAIAICPNLRHLHVRPLHDSARDGLLAALKVTKLETLICSPRLSRPDLEWKGCMWLMEDIAELILPSLKNFELDAWALASAGRSYPSILLTSSIVRLRLRFDCSDDYLNAVLAAAGSTLQVADIYMERMVSVEETVAALRPCFATIRDLRWTTNLPVEGFGDVNLSLAPLFDRILPHFEVLERLCISGTDVSPAILSHIPDSLVDLEVQAYTYRGPFKFEDQMIASLEDKSGVKMKSLKKFTVYDSEEVWTATHVANMTKACQARGITFKFVPDEEDFNDSR